MKSDLTRRRRETDTWPSRRSVAMAPGWRRRSSGSAGRRRAHARHAVWKGEAARVSDVSTSLTDGDEVEVGVGGAEVGLEVHGGGGVARAGRPREWGGRRGGRRPPDPRPGRRREVEPLDRLGDEPVELGGPDLPATAATWASTQRGGLAQGGGGVDGGLRDEPGPPGRHRPGVDLAPEPGEAVAELEGMPDQLLRRRRRDARARRRARRRRTPPPAGSPRLRWAPRARDPGS